MTGAKKLTQGLNCTLDADDVAFVESVTTEVLANGLGEALRECGDMGEALDCLIVSARAYVAKAEHLREIYLQGMH